MPNKPKNQNTDKQQLNSGKNPEFQSYLDEQAEGIGFLRKKFANLHTSPEVTSAAKRTKIRTGEKLSQKPEVGIANYLHRFREILDREDENERQRGIEALRKILYREHIIKPEDVPQNYWNKQAEIIINQGRKAELFDAGIEEKKTIDKSGNERADYIFPEKLRQQNTEVLIADQKSTLDKWLNYLADSKDYPDWAKYWAFRSILGLSTYDKEKKIFGRREKDTVAPFPDLNREALAFVVDMINKKAKGQNIESAEENHELKKLLQGAKFGKLYAYAIEEVTPAESDELENTAGEWITYKQGSNHMPLVKSLQGHGTGWCTAGESTAETQLKGGDFHVYYSYDADGNPTVPRIAIRMEGNKIGEVRGIAHEQNFDPYITPVFKKKLKEFGSEGESYQKKSADMKYLTEIEKKYKKDEKLSTEEILFLYEVDSPIEGFGYKCDPRINEIKENRNIKEDANVINIISSLVKRFNNPPKHYERPDGIDINKVKASIEASPEAKKSLALMELTGGAPDIIGETDTEYIFADCSAESPNRRNLNYDQSEKQAEEFGVEMMSEEIYRKIQEAGKFDMNSWSWLKTDPKYRRKTGGAVYGYRGDGYVDVNGRSADSRSENRGWRGVLRVPKV